MWSSTVPDESAAATLGDPEAGSQWVTVNVAQWVTDEGLSDVDVAPVLHSTADESFTAAGRVAARRRGADDARRCPTGS